MEKEKGRYICTSCDKLRKEIEWLKKRIVDLMGELDKTYKK